MLRTKQRTIFPLRVSCCVRHWRLREVSNRLGKLPANYNVR